MDGGRQPAWEPALGAVWDPASDPAVARAMERAVALGESVRGLTSPNPWVGAVLITPGATSYEGATEPPGGRHAEIVAIDAAVAAGAPTRGSTLVVTLEPCCHVGRTGPCTEAIIDAGVARVVVGIEDPDVQVAGRGIAGLRSAGIAVEVASAVQSPAEGVGVGVAGVGAGVAAAESLLPYVKHRRTGRPWVTLKMAATLDGRTAAADGSSRWITGEDARRDVHRLRARADAVLVGAGTVRADDPELTVRLVEGRDPRRVVLGRAPEGARVRPALELGGDLGEVLDRLGTEGILEVLVEGGARVAQEFHASGLVDRYVVYLAPALMGGGASRPLLDGPPAATIAELWRGRLVSVERLGDDLKVELEPLEARGWA
jgi:diaminohydroxyphosphoribosylaminopyrimidine deaminase/5-amino-6-(5-phosphoribosylamino)uracil reductase